MVHKGK
ncbi:hypothetical protein ABFA07_011711 [Porites harrisoni]